MTLPILVVVVGARDTSLATYIDILKSGKISDMQKIVYEGVYKFGPCTSSELYEHMSLGQNLQHSNIRARLGELRDMGAVSEMSKRKCAVTERAVLTWDVTMEMPDPSKKKLSKKDKVDRLLDELRDFYASSQDPWIKHRIKIIADMAKGI